MEVKHRSLLRGKRMVLCQAINSDIVVKHLTKSNVLSTFDQETLKSIKSDLKKNEKLLDILPKRGSKAFPAFLEALKLNKLAHLLGDGYEGEDNADKTYDDKNIKMNEQRPPERNTSKQANIKVDEKSYDIIDVPSKAKAKEPFDIAGTINGTTNGKESYDIVDVPRDKGVPMGVPQHNMKGNGDVDIDVDIVPDPGGKQAKVEEPFFYDSVDTPKVTDASDVSNKFPVLTDHNGTSSKGMMINIDATDSGGKDATDSAPASAVSPEFEDGPFNLKRKEVPEPSSEQADSSIPQCTLDESNCYSMSRNPRGYFLLVNNKNFLPESTMENYPRNGTDVDAKAMVELFQELGYIVDAHRNLTCNQIRRAVKKLVSNDYSKVSAVACCFLSHGKEGILYGTDGEIEIKDLTGYFRDQNGLVGKPKMFFFQACQGSDYMDSVEPAGGRMEVDGRDMHGNDISLPTEADFIYAYSTVPGYYSWRNSVKGSWFIQAIVDVFRKHAHKMDLIRMLTRVNQIVSTKKSATGQNPSHNKRQICSIITQLRYELYLFPPHGPLKRYSTT